MRERKYIQFLKDVGFGKDRYINNVKYRIVDETEDSYIISKGKNISFNKSKEGELYITRTM